MPPAYEILLLNTAIPQIQAAQAGDTYVVPRDIAINATAIISANSATDALRITQIGAGNAILVEDSANPDSTPFVVTATGDVGIGTSSPLAKFQVGWGSDQFQLTNPSTGFKRLGASYTGYVSGNIYSSIDLGAAGGAGGTILFNTMQSGFALATKATIDEFGNLGLGVAPSAWANPSVYKAFEIGAPGNSFYSASGETHFTTNCFFNTSGQNIYGANGFATEYQQASGQHRWYTAASGTAGNAITFTQAMTLDASGNLGVGTTLQNERLRLNSSSNSQARMSISYADSTIAFFGSYSGIVGSGNATDVMLSATNVLAFGAGGTTERARITSGGYFKASNDGTYGNSTGTYHELYQSANSSGVEISAVNASYTSTVAFIIAARNTTNNSFYALDYYNTGAGAFKFRVADSGDVTNTNGTYGTISDAKMKTDIVDAGSQWSDIKALRFRKFKMKDDPDQRVQLGVVAQEVELTSPGLVDEHADRDAEGNDLGTTTKSVKTSVLLMKAAVALQEAMARIEQLEAKVAALEAN